MTTFRYRFKACFFFFQYYREALHEASDELVEVVEDKDESSFGERLSCVEVTDAVFSATLLKCPWP